MAQTNEAHLVCCTMWAMFVAALLPSILLHQVPNDEPIVLERTEEQSQGEELGQFLRMDTKLHWRPVRIRVHMCKGQIQGWTASASI